MRTKFTLFLITAFTLITIGCPSNNTNQSSETGESPSGAIGKSASQSKKIDAPSNNIKNSNSKPKERVVAKNSKIKSVYTDLADDKCKTTKLNEEEQWSEQICEGTAGYKLEVLEGDIRQTINVIAPDKKKYELNMWGVVSSGFSSVGKKAEWRVKKEKGVVKPIALIVRYNVSENPESPEKTTSYLTVTKITKTATCITDVVKPIKNANVKARKLADASADKP